MILFFFVLLLEGYTSVCLFRVSVTGLHKWVSHRLGCPTLRQNKVQWEIVSHWEQTSIWKYFSGIWFELCSSSSRCEEIHSVCLCIWILSPPTCLSFDFLTYSLAAFLLQCSAHCVVFHLLVSVSYLIRFQAMQGSQSAFHKDNIAELNRWGINVLSVISIALHHEI